MDAQGRVVWIGYPYDLHEVFKKILNNTWNVKEAREAAIAQWYLNSYLDSLDVEAGKKQIFKYEGNYYTKDDLGNPDSALLVINGLVSKEPKLKYATITAYYTFTALLKTNPDKAYEYGKETIMTNYEGSPSYQAIIGGIKNYVYKLKLPAEIYQLGTEAYEAEIAQNPYPELFDPEIYNTIANWYWLAGNKSKAMKARRKFKKLKTMYTTVRWDYLQ